MWFTWKVASLWNWTHCTQPPEPMAEQLTPESLLRTHWGHAHFRPLQREIILASLEGRDVVGILPTGAGKSLCFQIAGRLRGGLTLVISPLIALMHDQVQGLEKRGLPATYLNSTLAPEEIERRLRGLLQGQFHFLYLSPEWLHNERMRVQAPRLNIRLLVVDEAHCVSQWGFDFRPDYLRIQSAHQWLPKVPTMAVTATATPLVRDDIASLLKLRQPAVFVHSFARPNLRYSVLYEEDRHGKLLEMLAKVKGTALVYVRSRKGTAQLAEYLQQHGESAAAYHAGLPAHIRSQLQLDWQQNRTRILVATNAFGMGIDKPDVRLVVHWQLPPDLESYYQEAGRAGRDGQVAFCVLLFVNSEVQAAQQRIGERYPSYDALEAVYNYLTHQHQLSTEYADTGALHGFDPGEVAADLGLTPNTLSACIRVLQQQGLLHMYGDMTPRASVRFTTTPPNLRDFKERNPILEPLLEALLRMVGGEAFVHACTYPPEKLRQATAMGSEQIEQQLAYLQKLGLLQYRGSRRQHYLRYLKPRANPSPAMLGWHTQEQLRGLSEQRLHQLVQYAADTHSCRQVLLCRYFGEELTEPCGKCDVCSGRHKTKVPRKSAKTLAALEAEILSLLEDGPRGMADVLARLTQGSPAQRPHAINRLIETGKVRLSQGFLLERI